MPVRDNGYGYRVFGALRTKNAALSRIQIIFFLLSGAIALAACVGYTPTAIVPTEPEVVQPEATLTQAALPATWTPRPALPTATPAPESTLGVSPDDLNGVAIQFWYARSENGAAVLQALVDEFNSQNAWNIRVETRSFANHTTLYDQAQADLSGDLPDLVMGYPYQAAALDTSTNVLVDLEPYTSDPIYGFSAEEQADFYAPFWQEDILGDKRLGVPFWRSVQVLFYNLTWAEELEIAPPPENPPQFKAQACAAALANRQDELADNDGTGGWAVNTDSATILSWVYAYGSEVTLPGERVYQFDTGQTEKAFAFLRGLYDDGCAYAPDGPYPNADFAARRALFISSGLEGFPAQEAALQAAESQDQWTVLAYPSSGGTPAMNAFGVSLQILESTPEQQLAAWLLAQYLVTPESQARWVEQTGLLPVRAGAEPLLSQYREAHPQWGMALDLLPYAQAEPSFPSWARVRWVVGDAGAALFSPTVTLPDIPRLIDMLAATAAEVDGLYR